MDGHNELVQNEFLDKFDERFLEDRFIKEFYSNANPTAEEKKYRYYPFVFKSKGKGHKLIYRWMKEKENDWWISHMSLYSVKEAVKISNNLIARSRKTQVLDEAKVS